MWTKKKTIIKNAYMLIMVQVPCLGLQQILHHCWKLSEPVHCIYGELQVLFPHTPWDPKQKHTISWPCKMITKYTYTTLILTILKNNLTVYLHWMPDHHIFLTRWVLDLLCDFLTRFEVALVHQVSWQPSCTFDQGL